jgi:predicted transcriptional regulator
VPRLDFSVELPDELSAELRNAAAECQITPTKFASQAIEATLASRRLETALHGRCGPRLRGRD